MRRVEHLAAHLLSRRGCSIDFNVATCMRGDCLVGLPAAALLSGSWFSTWYKGFSVTPSVFGILATSSRKEKERCVFFSVPLVHGSLAQKSTMCSSSVGNGTSKQPDP